MHPEAEWLLQYFSTRNEITPSKLASGSQPSSCTSSLALILKQVSTTYVH